MFLQRFFFLLILLLGWATAQAQQGFNRYYQHPNSRQTAFGSVIVEKDRVVVAGYIVERTHRQPFQPLLMAMDKATGSLQYDHLLIADTNYSMCSALSERSLGKTKSGYFTTGIYAAVDTDLPGGTIYMMELDSTFHTSSLVFYTDSSPYQYSIGSVDYTIDRHNNKYLVGGQAKKIPDPSGGYPNYFSNIFMLKLDSSNQVVWTKPYNVFGDSLSYNYLVGIVPSGEDKYMALGYTRGGSSLSTYRPYWAYTYYIEFDTGGTILRKKTDSTLINSLSASQSLYRTADGGFAYLTVQAIPNYADPVGSGTFVNVCQLTFLDSAWQVIKRVPLDTVRDIGYTGYERLIQLKNGSFAVLYYGRYDTSRCQNEILFSTETGGCCWGRIRAKIVKLSKDGDIIWRKSYRDEEDLQQIYSMSISSYSYVFHDMAEDTATGDLYVCGDMIIPPNHTYPQQVGWLLRLNSEGCVIPGCSTGVRLCDMEEPMAIVPIATQKFLLYPNPATNQLHFTIEDNNKYDIVFYNLMGQKIHSQQIEYNTEIDVRQWEQGIYFYQLLENGKPIGSGKIIKE